MSLKKDGERRWVELEVLVPGTPEQVWHALATGDGFSAWFTRTTIEERVGGAVLFDLGGGHHSKGTVTCWEPPARFCLEERDWSGEAPPLATEIVVTRRGDQQCLVRMVHSLFTRRTDWDDEIEGFEQGWPGFFEVLRLYLRHFAEQPAHAAGVSGMSPHDNIATWQQLTAALGVASPTVGEQRSAPSGAPALGGQIERVLQTREHCQLLLRLERPAPGIASISSYVWQARTRLAVSLYFYGPGSRAVAEAAEPEWRSWLASKFPAR